MPPSDMSESDDMESQNVGRIVYEEHEAAFLWDYLHFGADLRHFTADMLMEPARSENEYARRYGLLGVFREMMSALEDFAALLTAFRRKYAADDRCSFQREFSTPRTPVFYTLVNYRETSLARTIGERSAEQVYEDFSFAHLVPEESSEPPSSECADLLRRIAAFLVVDCAPQEATAARTAAYNKIKHGAVVISNGAVFFPKHPLGPAVLDVNRVTPTTAYPLLVFTIPLDDMKLETYFKMNWVSTSCRKLLIAFYLWAEQRPFVRSKGVQEVAELFDGHMWDVFRFTQLGTPASEPGHVT